MSTIILQGANEIAQNIHYEIETESEPLGVGGMGKVYKGVRVENDTRVRKDVAVKFLFDDLPAHAIERARREASIQIHNDNLIEMFGFIEIDEETDTGEIHHRYHVVSELLKGVMLFDLLKGKTTDNSGEEIPYAVELYKLYNEDRIQFAIHIIKCILSGIMALHDKKYIHRDIDPSNIMITHDGKVKLIDLGIAKPISDKGTSSTIDKHLTIAGQFIGKAAYAAPELVIGDIEHENRTTDLYAIGILFFQLVTGHLPFEGAMLDVLDMQLHQNLPLQEIASKNVRKVIAKATAKRQTDRYATASEFRVAVEQLENTTTNDMSITSAIGEKTKMIEDVAKKITKKRYKIITGSIVVILLVAVAGGVVSSKKQHLKTENEQKEKLEQLRTILRDSLIDSQSVDSIVNEEVGEIIKTAGLVTKEATEKLLDQNTAIRQEGIEMLKYVVQKGYKSSAEAAFLLGRLYYEKTESDSTLQQMKLNTANLLNVDNSIAFHYDTLSVQLDKTHYKALYECGCDFLGGKDRTNIENSRDIEKAKSYFISAYRYAKGAGDTKYIENCRRRLKSLGIKTEDILSI